MEKRILEQYQDLKAECRDLRERIRKLEGRIKAMEKGPCIVSDYVKGTRPDGTYGGIRITGFPVPDYYRRKGLLEAQKERMAESESRLLELAGEADDFICSMEDSRMRRMARYRFLDGLSWIQVAHRMGGRHTADACRKQIERFFEEK